MTSTLNVPLVLCAEHERAVCFQRKFIDEVRKADAFYTGKIDALARTLDYLQTSCATELPHKQRRDDDDDVNNAARFAARGLGQKRSRQSMKRACLRLHKEALRLDTFRSLTYTACVKITKKHDKLAARAYAASLAAAVGATGDSGGGGGDDNGGGADARDGPMLAPPAAAWHLPSEPPTPLQAELMEWVGEVSGFTCVHVCERACVRACARVGRTLLTLLAVLQRSSNARRVTG